MLTANPASDPRPSHTVKVVGISTAVNPESHCGSQVITKAVISARSAMQRASIAADVLRECSNLPFQVMVNGKSVVISATPAPPVLPAPFISTELRKGVWVPTEYLQP